MKIVIIGAGATGTNIARQLEKENHEVYIVESNRSIAEKVNEKIDAKIIIGNSTDPEILKEAGIEEADLLVAVTFSDEMNLTVCALADVMGRAKKIARIRNPSLAEIIEKKGHNYFHLDEIINPEKISAEMLSKIILDSGAKEAIDFAEGKVLLRAVDILEKDKFCCRKLKDLRKENRDLEFLFVAIKRNEELIIPHGDTEIKEKDRVYILMSSQSKDEFFKRFFSEEKDIEKIVIFGASAITENLILNIGKKIKNIVVIEPNERKAKKLSEKYDSVFVVNGMASDPEILKECGVKSADMFISASLDEHSNLVSAMLAKKMDVTLTAIVTYQSDYYPIVEAMGIDVVIYPRILAAYNILKYVRGDKIRHVAKLVNFDMEVVEITAEEKSPITKSAIKDIKFPNNIIMGAVIKDGRAHIINGDTVIKPEESVVVFCKGNSGDSLKKLFSRKKTLF